MSDYVNPLSVYASTKLAAEKHLLDKNSLIFRLGTLFGVGDEYARRLSVLAQLGRSPSGFLVAGSQMRKVLPRPTADSTPMRPPCSVTIP